jgi:S-adenosylmethionine:tRNA ribosyltransferase-isomerase
MDISLFDFDLPDDRIALRPAVPRDAARMMVVHGDGRIAHSHVRDLPDYLGKGDVLLVNDTRVIPARLHGVRLRPAGAARIEILLHRRLAPDRYSILARPARKLTVGDKLRFGELQAEVIARGNAGEAEVRFLESGAVLDDAIAALGEMPLPPYIAGKRKADLRDASDYQTVYAVAPGSVAAPTAGLHFTPALFAELERRGVSRHVVTLNVGLGTFLPVAATDTADHRMHAEQAELTAKTADRLNAVHAAGGRICAVGTTSLRTLESGADKSGIVHPFRGDTDIFITPGYHFRATDILLTNFHLPRSTLFMLVSAFMGLDVMRTAYSEAIKRGYRFYSYGDACLLLPKCRA